LPPGWTDSKVAQIQPEFEQSITDLKTINDVQAKAKTAITTLASASAPLMSPLPNPKVNKIRRTIVSEVVRLQKRLVTASTAATNPDTLTPTLEQKIARIRSHFDALVARLGQPTASAADDLDALRGQVQQALSNLGGVK